MITVQEYLTDDGVSPFAKWFNRLNIQAALKIRTTIARMDAENLSNTKGVGAGVQECRLDFGPGYRIYFGRDGDKFVILLGGGTKKRQSKDIATAKELWAHYKTRKRMEK